MTEISTPRQAATATATGWVDRALAAIPLALVVTWLGAVYALETVWRKTPTLFSDELKWAQLSRAIAAGGHAAQRGLPAPFASLYSYVIAPAWWADGTTAGYDAAKYISIFAMTLAALPAYFLARRLVSKPAALLVAAATAAVPSMAYGLYLIPESVAYPWSTLCAFLIVGALAVRSRPWIGAAIAASLLAPLVRGQLVVVPVSFALAAFGLWWWQDARARRLRASWSPLDRLGLLLLAFGCFLVLNRWLLHGVNSWSITSEFYRGEIYRNALWALGALTIGVGVLPMIAAVVALFPAPGEERSRWDDAFVVVLAAYLVSFLVYTGVKAAYLQVTFATRVTERNLFYVAPLFFLAAAIALERRRVRLVPLAVGVGVTAYLLATVPIQLDYPYFEALGFSILAFANRELYWSVDAIHLALYVTLAVATAALAGAWALRDRTLAPRARAAATATAAILGVAVLAWNLGGQITAASASGGSSEELARNMPHPFDWIDRDTRGAPATYLGQTLGTDGAGINLLEFWNRSVVNVWSLDGTAPGPGPTLSPDLGSTDGTLATQPGTPYLVADNGVNPVGRPIDHWQGLRVYRVSGPLRLADWVSGIQPDGWMSTDSTYSRFAANGSHSQTAVVTLSRQGFCPDPARHVPPGKATVKVGQLIINENHQPALGAVRSVSHVVVNHCRPNRFRIHVGPPPWRIEVHIDGTFRPSDYGGSDARDLGAVVGYRLADER